MKKHFIQFWKSSSQEIYTQNNTGLESSCAGRILNAMTFIVVILYLGLWITIFLILKDKLFAETLSGRIFTEVNCFTFFGGLIIAIFIGALTANFLRRSFWKRLIRRTKR